MVGRTRKLRLQLISFVSALMVFMASLAIIPPLKTYAAGTDLYVGYSGRSNNFSTVQAAVDRAASYLQHWKKDYEQGCCILSDRYATSNIIYQMSKLDDSERDSFIEWQSDFEYEKLGIPKPDVVIYLDVEPQVSQKLMEKRYGGDISKKDIHEKNLKYLRECRRSALYAAEKCSWRIINCCENGEIKTIEKISEEIDKAVSDILC